VLSIAELLNPFLQSFYRRIQRRRVGGKAIIAFARQFLGVIFHTRKHDWVYEDLLSFVLARYSWVTVSPRQRPQVDATNREPSTQPWP